MKTSSTNEEKIAALADMICRAGDEAGTTSAALLVLMSALENASHPKALANLAKHVAFTRRGELNLNGMVETQIAVFESELFSRQHACVLNTFQWPFPPPAAWLD